MMPCSEVCRRLNRLVVLLASGFVASAQAGSWPTHEFVIVNSGPRVPIRMPVVANTGFEGEQARMAATLEAYLGEVAAYYDGMGFKAPRLDLVDGRQGGKAWIVHLHDYPDSLTHARYATGSAYLEADLSRAVDSNGISDDLMEALPHELFHAVQRAYTDPGEADHGDWIIEGQAQAVGMDTARRLRCIDVHKGGNDDYRLGGREYAKPLPNNVPDNDYRTASFWRYIGEARAARQRGGDDGCEAVDVDYRYLVTVLGTPFTDGSGDNADLTWLDRGLRKATGDGLAQHYANFAATIAGYVPARLTKTPSGTPEQATANWLKRLFGSCPAVTLTATSPSGSTTAALQPNAARCFSVTVQQGAAAGSSRAATGADFLRRVRGKRGGGDVNLAIRARADSRKDLEALWLGMAGGEDVASAFIGRDRDGYVGDWQFKVTPDEAQTFVVSNMAEDPTHSADQNVRLTLFTSSASMSSSSGGFGDLAGAPVDLRFDRFTSRDILSADSETQTKAGIERPCMLRLRMQESGSHAGFAIEIDNDGPIKPGSFSVTDGIATEKVPGRFIGGFSFGWGADRVSYRAEGGTVELTAFGPGLVSGKASLLGRLPPKAYGDKPSAWPETMSVQTEFSIVPRVNLNSRLFKRRYCFE
ncbi:MAG: hypothetical protein KDI75_03590 [Xanthomonadales bacterium]|nr:hypothetical protein [Xanthomonadales bacterium]